MITLSPLLTTLAVLYVLIAGVCVLMRMLEYIHRCRMDSIIAECYRTRVYLDKREVEVLDTISMDEAKSNYRLRVDGQMAKDRAELRLVKFRPKTDFND